MSVSSEQIRAARGLLGISQKELAEAAKMSHNSLNNIERGVASPRPDTLEAIRKTLERLGVDFTENNGVRMSGEMFKVNRVEGADILFRLYEDILKTMRMKELREVLYLGMDNKRFGHTELEKLQAYKAFEKELIDHSIPERLIFKETDRGFLSDRNCYRFLREDLCSTLPIVIYGVNVAMLPWGPPQRLIIIRNADYAESMRRQFEASWTLADPVPDDVYRKNKVIL